MIALARKHRTPYPKVRRPQWNPSNSGIRSCSFPLHRQRNTGCGFIRAMDGSILWRSGRRPTNKRLWVQLRPTSHLSSKTDCSIFVYLSFRVPQRADARRKTVHAHLHFQVGRQLRTAGIFGRPRGAQAAGAIPTLACDWRHPPRVGASA